MMTFLFSFLTLIFFATDLRAENLNVLICRGGKYSLGRSVALKEIAKATEQMDRELGTRWKRRNLKVTSCGTYGNWKRIYSGREFGKLSRLLGNNWETRRSYNLAIIPALEDGKRRGIGGVSSDTCSLVQHWNLTVAALAPINHLGEDRLTEASTVIAHELAHAVGCEHDNSTPVNMMHENPMPYVKPLGPLKFVEQCKQEYRVCQEDIRYYESIGWLD